jgi:UDP-glucose:(heptosyl)LPS alpha-1,3-glucosyltransferase
MRVAVLIRKWGIGGGNERVAVDLARHLASRDHQVTVVCQRIETPEMPALERVTVRRLRSYYWGTTLAHLTFARGARAFLREMEKKREVDVSIGFNHSIEQDVYRLGSGTQAENLRLAHELAVRRPNPMVDRVALDLERRRFREGAFRLLIAPSFRVKEEIVRHYAVDAARIEVIWNGVDLDRFRPECPPEERARVRREWGVKGDEPLLLFVGHSLERKGFDVAVRVAEHLGLRLVYIGAAERPKQLASRVAWVGQRNDLDRCYRAADVLLAPSRYDPFGGVVLEALASGLPAVATRRIGATERARGTLLDQLFIEEAEDLAGMTERVQLALDPKRRPSYASTARAIALSASREDWGKQVEDVLIRLAAR